MVWGPGAQRTREGVVLLGGTPTHLFLKKILKYSGTIPHQYKNFLKKYFLGDTE